MEQNWIPILDYAVLRGVSTSTLRRYIKAKKVQYKIENGRYLLLADAQLAQQYAQQQAPRRMLRPNWDGFNPYSEQTQAPAPAQAAPAPTNDRVRELEAKLMRAQEQITELKMLVATYEEMLAQSNR